MKRRLNKIYSKNYCFGEKFAHQNHLTIRNHSVVTALKYQVPVIIQELLQLVFSPKSSNRVGIRNHSVVTTSYYFTTFLPSRENIVTFIIIIIKCFLVAQKSEKIVTSNPRCVKV